ncbi:hypothetical protein ACIRJS_45425 [Streptomyces sp. NPDC102340]|uniref:hypothetical protein n=1 Tax=unclassified Streptomyces TaxID=2593676 RepID=UPI00380F9D32
MTVDLPPTVEGPQLPLEKRAFDHPETRRNWRRARRRARRTVALEVIGLLVFLAVVGLLNDGPRSKPVWMRVVLLVCVIATPFVIAFVLYSLGPILRLRRIRRVLRDHPWEYCEAVRPCPGAKDVMGVLVQLRTDSGDGWSGTMRAINPLRRKRWSGEMEQGAWFAGSLEAGGVIAVPGGCDLMTLEHESLGSGRRR